MDMQNSVSALLVGDFDVTDRLILREVFQRLGWRLLEAWDRKKAMLQLDCDAIQVVLIESDAPGSTWKTLLSDLQRRGYAAQLVVTSRTADNGLWAEVLNLGGYDLLHSQPLHRDELQRVIASAARHAGIRPASACAASASHSRVA